MNLPRYCLVRFYRKYQSNKEEKYHVTRILIFLSLSVFYFPLKREENNVAFGRYDRLMINLDSKFHRIQIERERGVQRMFEEQEKKQRQRTLDDDGDQRQMRDFSTDRRYWPSK